MTGALRAKVRRRARGRCEYCRTPFRYDFVPAEIDHVIAGQHGGEAVLDNLAMACAHCNSHKGPNIAGIDPKTRKLTRLFNPRTDRWDEHFMWFGATAVGRTPEGRTTINVLGMNGPFKLAARAALMEEKVFGA